MMISLICLLTLILIIWFKTNAFIEYMKALCLLRFCKVREFLEAGHGMTYHEFLLEYYNNFFVRLITCPICVSVWLGAILSLFFGLKFFSIITVAGLSLYLLISKLL